MRLTYTHTTTSSHYPCSGAVSRFWNLEDIQFLIQSPIIVAGKLATLFSQEMQWVTRNIQMLSTPLWAQKKHTEQSLFFSGQIQEGVVLYHSLNQASYCDSLQWGSNGPLMFFHQDLVRSVLTAACIRVGRLSMRPERYQPWGFHVLFFKNHKLIHCILKIALAQVQVMLTFFFLGKNTKHLLRYSLASRFPFAQDLSSSPSLWNFYLVGGRA